MNDREATRSWQGLRMSSPPDPGALARERALLTQLASRPAAARIRGYFGLLGPGYLQSAMTLGGGTVSSALFAGAIFGYELLWVAPLAMALGLVMLSAVSWQTLSTGRRPWPAMREHAGPFFAWAWALGALLSSIIWQFPQYALASAVLVDMGDVVGLRNLSPVLTGGFVLAWALVVSGLYGRSERAVRVYERLLQTMVWGIVVCFAWVVFQTGVSDWDALFRGFFTFQVPGERNGVAAVTLVLSGVSAAVGVNMVFLYPYTLLARGWGREHRELSQVDLLLGMFVPYAIAVSLVVIATANTLHLDAAYQGTQLSPVEAARVLAEGVGPIAGRLVFGVGVLGMALSSITLQMLTCGFVAVELFGLCVGSWQHRLATWLPVPGVLGCVYWSDVAVWVAVPTNIVCGLFLPAAYAGFCLLQRSRAYLGEDRPTGAFGAAWLAAMLGVTLFLVSFLAWYVLGQLG
ncbi:MAG: divalent metal cation transporter [Deltaproteobacteria bacterium]|nr:divalent metal cation transporter [Deltaproteobacteria bacterium]MBW2359315.1 divalent metal cation transporter [Deltaproteobacteria bacterium]